jgi:hypothetical protein
VQFRAADGLAKEVGRMTQFLHDTYITAMNEYSAEIAQAQADFTVAIAWRYWRGRRGRS